MDVSRTSVSTFLCVVEDEVDDEFGGIVDVASSYDKTSQGLGYDVPPVESSNVNILYLKRRHILKWI
jgi:hypothetical protein